MRRDKKEHRILVIEDNPGDFIIVEDLLREQIVKPDITHAINCQMAMDILGAGVAFDVILLDLSLPDKSDQNLISEILQVTLSCPIIILTGYDDIDFSIRSIAQGIMDYLFKDDLNAVTLYKSIIYAIERKKTTAELKASEKRYSDIFQLSPQPMWVFDPETLRFIEVNKAATILYGYTEEEFLSMTIKEIRYNEDDSFAEGLKTEIKNNVNNFSQEEHRHRKKNGEAILVEIYDTTIFLKAKNAQLVVVVDTTEKANYISTVENQNKKLLEIAWIQSHVVRAPLARMMMLTDMIKNYGLADEEKADMLNNLLDSATELDTVIRGISKKISA